MGETGHIVVYGLKKFGWYFYIFSRRGDGLKEEGRIKSPCYHGSFCLLNLIVLWKEYLAIACYDCKDIKLIDLKTQDVVTAFSGEEVYKMCSGWHKLFVSIHGTDQVLELDTSSTAFTKVRTFSSGHGGFYDMCYAPHPLNLLVTTGQGTIAAVDCTTGELAWTNDDQVEGKEIMPRQVVFLPRQNAVFVSEFSSFSEFPEYSKKFLVYDVRTGHHLQTIHAKKGHLKEHKGQIVVGEVGQFIFYSTS